LMGRSCYACGAAECPLADLSGQEPGQTADKKDAIVNMIIP